MVPYIGASYLRNTISELGTLTISRLTQIHIMFFYMYCIKLLIYLSLMPYMPPTFSKILCHLFQVVQIQGKSVPVYKVKGFKASASLAFVLCGA